MALCLGQKGLERNATFIFNHVMHCDLEQELGQVLGGQVDYWPTQFGWRLLTFMAYSN